MKTLHIQFGWGSTRFVILTGEGAIKIGRVRPVRVLLHLFSIPFSQTRREHFFDKYGHDLLPALWQDLMAGPISNLLEYNYCLECRDGRVMPVTTKYFGGLVIIQEEGGDEVTIEELIREHPVQNYSTVPKNADMGTPDQFRRRKSTGEVVLVDFGKKTTLNVLRLSLTT
ncbi:MAG: hypothetical protein WC629_01395 [Candidatus Paceibacterota bacterium]|jgi:hypothetical protein